ncbi:DUF5660 family protein [Patescibacteria group bacterium]
MNQPANSQKKSDKNTKRANVLENLRELNTPVSKDLLNRLMGIPTQEKKYSGDLAQGESLEMNEVFKGTLEENKKLKGQMMLEKRLSEEERVLSENKSNQLKVQLQALIQEITSLAKATTDIAKETQVAMIHAPASPGVYHITFFENVLSFLKSFREKIEDASIWLSASNKRAEKKNYWAMYKKKGSSFLLAPDHYVSRAAG